MSCNNRVTAQANRIGDAKSPEDRAKEKELYFQILEEELRKQPQFNLWIDYEDPVDVLEESLCNKDNPERVAEVLEDYKRYREIVDRVAPDHSMKTDYDLIWEAEEYIASHR